MMTHSRFTRCQVLLVVGVAVAFSGFVVGLILWWRYRPLLAARRAQPLVDAIHDYRREHGLWPQRLSDVLKARPDLLSFAGAKYKGSASAKSNAFSSRDWRYHWADGTGFELCLTIPRLGPHVHTVSYIVRRHGKRWSVSADRGFLVRQVVSLSSHSGFTDVGI